MRPCVEGWVEYGARVFCDLTDHPARRRKHANHLSSLHFCLVGCDVGKRGHCIWRKRRRYSSVHPQHGTFRGRRHLEGIRGSCGEPCDSIVGYGHRRLCVLSMADSWDPLLGRSKQLGDIDKTKLKTSEALKEPGTKEGEVKMIRNEDQVEVYQWSASESRWQKIGEVVDAIGHDRKQIYEGREYDYVFDIQLSETGPGLKLPFNASGKLS